MKLFPGRPSKLPEGSLSRKALQNLLKNNTAMISAGIIAAAVLTALLGYLITPDSSPFANEQHLEIAAQKPGFSVSMLKVTANEPENRCPLTERWLYGCKNAYSYIPFNDYCFENGKIILSAYDRSGDSNTITYEYLIQDVLYALPSQDGKLSFRTGLPDLRGKIIGDDSLTLQNEIIQHHIISRHYLLGTDRLGRDILSQLLIGTRVSLSVGLISVIISLLLGILLGALAGFFRGWVDDLIIWFINVIWSIPTILLVIAITFVLGKGFWQVFIAVGLTMWVEVARVVRGQILSLREKEFVEAARALGFKNGRIIARHILPNAMGPVIVISAANFASAILIEAGLSFLGIGVQPPMPSWGTMIRENYSYIILDNPWLAILPGMCIMILVLAFMLIGNGLRDALDVKTTTTV
ncbi:ABC-type dipeptide/oligopeptide/nickel transport system, permease component [Lentimicrobium saccharophilum]|uniref:ABC-type dipeptide/oligopeptide/nickel transport system, permease component n=1 Tax=Lentimicrobium saccharophilum TaxID=1678841 RepID=A0A0S7C797_9BACT|nr:ABC transporter permease [Lentimicrobium saccharophilum]GAP44863.1 ABC-type dipeptide/oligopeptide/nickel transport system, permease component [Lentimicrobium saccharophilum]